MEGSATEERKKRKRDTKGKKEETKQRQKKGENASAFPSWLSAGCDNEKTAKEQPEDNDRHSRSTEDPSRAEEENK